MKKQKGKGQKGGGGPKKNDSGAIPAEESLTKVVTAEEAEDVTETSKSTTDGAEDGQDVASSGDKDGPKSTVTEESHDSPGTSTKPQHNRQPSLSLQSKMRSSSFRRTSVSQSPRSPDGTKSPELPILSPDGDSVNSIYRKQAARLDELEKENRRLAKESQEFERKWKQTEEELEELREASGDVAELKTRAQKAEAQIEEFNKLVCHRCTSSSQSIALWS